MAASTVTNWRKRADPIPGTPGDFDLDEIDKWYADAFPEGSKAKRMHDTKRKEWSKVDDTIKPGDSLTTKTKKQDLRIKRARAAQEEAKAELVAGRMIEYEDVNRFVAKLHIDWRRLLLSIPKDMCAGYSDKVREQVEPDLKKRLELFLVQQADQIERCQDLQPATAKATKYRSNPGND